MKKTPEEIVAQGVAEIRAFVRDRLESSQAALQHEIDERTAQVVATAAVVSRGSAGIIESARYLFAKDTEIPRGMLALIETRIGSHFVQYDGESDIRPGRYRAVLALLPLDEEKR